ncbi:MAG TPA: amino acid ABC transporter permease [Chloroflexota bacterium]|jgi:polar amino acid transport system permease protein|nr:amino acid ABC transporter permease [Chloroflexota bacterium]
MPSWAPPVIAYSAQGLEFTLIISVITVAAGVVVGVLLGSLLTLPVAIVRVPSRIYVEVWRGLPIIITLFFVFFTLPAINLRLSAFAAACIGLSLWASANVAEIVRGAVQSIPGGQFQASAAMGFNWAQTMTYVILPQSVRRMLPPLVSLLANLIQSTSLAAVIGAFELLQAARRSIERLTVDTGNSEAIPILAAVLIVYFILCFPLAQASRRLEASLAV